MINRLVHTILELLYFLSKYFPKDKKLIIFGSWFGAKVGDNPKYLLDDMLATKNSAKFIWIGQESCRSEIAEYYGQRVKFSRKNSIGALYFSLRAKYIIVNQGYLDISPVNLSRGATFIQLWHGFPVKRIVDDMRQSIAHYSYFHYDYFLSTSPLMDQRMTSAFKSWGATDQNLIRSIQPRNQVLNLKRSEQEILVRKVKDFLQIAENKKIVLYMPTFRDNHDENFSFHSLTSSEKQFLIDHDIVLIQKPHFEGNELTKNSKDAAIIDIRPDFPFDVQYLLLLADVLITDYSSVYVDFLLLNRPIIHFVYDLDKFATTDRGFYNPNFSEEAAGPIVKNTSQLIDTIVSYSGRNDEARRSKLNNQFNEYRDVTTLIALRNLCAGLDKLFK